MYKTHEKGNSHYKNNLSTCYIDKNANLQVHMCIY